MLIDYLIWIWLGVIIVFSLLEFLTTDQICIYIAAAAVPSFIVSIFSKELWPIQLILFGALVIVFLAIVRPIIRHYYKVIENNKKIKASVGQIGYCLEPITPKEEGLVMLKGANFPAKTEDRVIYIGDKVKVIEIDGSKVIVTKVK